MPPTRRIHAILDTPPPEVEHETEPDRLPPEVGDIDVHPIERIDTREVALLEPDILPAAPPISGNLQDGELRRADLPQPRIEADLRTGPWNKNTLERHRLATGSRAGVGEVETLGDPPGSTAPRPDCSQSSSALVTGAPGSASCSAGIASDLGHENLILHCSIKIRKVDSAVIPRRSGASAATYRCHIARCRPLL